jgi:hypothetical protein
MKFVFLLNICETKWNRALVSWKSSAILTWCLYNIPYLWCCRMLLFSFLINRKLNKLHQLEIELGSIKEKLARLISTIRRLSLALFWSSIVGRKRLFVVLSGHYPSKLNVLWNFNIGYKVKFASQLICSFCTGNNVKSLNLKHIRHFAISEFKICFSRWSVEQDEIIF